MQSRLIWSAVFVVGLYLAVTTLSARAVEPLPVVTVAHRAETVGREMKFNICLPAEYQTSDERYPVIYLLHGLTSNYTAWAKMNVPHCTIGMWCGKIATPRTAPSRGAKPGRSTACRWGATAL